MEAKANAQPTRISTELSSASSIPNAAGEDDSGITLCSMPVPDFMFNINNSDDGEVNEKIPVAEAICRVCYDVVEVNNVIKTKCKCKFTLLHEKCSIQFFQEKGKKCDVCEEEIQPIRVTLSKCDVCEEEIRPIPVTLSEDHLDSTQGTGKLKKQTLKRFFGCLGLQALSS
ncbi:hypothetical protein CDL12_04104 [Handroanthus impetiginosus]|uniref:RING-CH-type domain-containing protein n=1 Tax=Handroanthus impetiginosus TaxID=429701 RepID=A0A2G9I074_9LAMI|nr:hypothetical protein CDL12_04104 [Handroanthus impetiginosus]